LPVPVVAPLFTSGLVVEDPEPVVVDSSTSGLVAELFVDSDGVDGVAADVSAVDADDVVSEDDAVLDDEVVFEDDVSSADDFVVPDDDVLVCGSLSVDAVPAFEFDDFEADEPDPVELLLGEDDDPASPLDEAPEPESSACATPVPVASATPSVTAPTPSHR